eukprot:Blabericola_migrator_1__10177@NODE_568_length_7541_cov_61_527562_g423_i0_p2_GENE_NODE_568_length_7541_cov_61_527562_g423_i0NODE_568_length_7541_cov_61_527562_g423_i0_p2_ORF_typecomplete_len871_score203_27SNF2_N/PF00176_23/1_5e44ResIII/PF04851_15/4_2e11ResIII/PF04851_15/41Helicase_C/PF00271_31/4_2e12DEAD/PF00270_29/3_2e06DEAD/PF00270_29/6_4e03ERCC3_RAD25_C/PF16203_5/0_00015Flavi_DEAD/PF07652_14/0_01Flavi_DEAD/PF07652_14/1_1e04DEAD_2/PF06733_15/2_2DEAD_2/PF06733_15/1_4e02TniB/PF05621_11/0_27_NODE_
MNDPKKSDGSQTCQFGKYKGKSFDEIRKTDSGYCTWVMQVETPGAPMVELINYLRSTGFQPKAPAAVKQIQSHHGLYGMSTGIDFDGDVARKRKSKSEWDEDSQGGMRKKGRFSTWLDDGLENAYDDEGYVSDDGFDDDDLRALEEFDQREQLSRIDAFGWGVKGQLPASPPRKMAPTQNAGLQSAGHSSPGIQNADKWLSASTANTKATSPKPASQQKAKPNINLSGHLIFEVCNAEIFRLQLESKRGAKTYMSTFMPPEIYSLVSKFRLQPAPTGKDGRVLSGICMSAKHYTDCVSILTQAVGSEMSTVPGFVLRAFPSFLPHAPPLTLQRKCANIFLQVNSPKTKKYTEDFEKHLGPRLLNELKVFQRDGVSFGLERNGRCLIGDEMGLGKTLQALAIVSIYRSEWPCLIVCPSSIRFQWKDQAARWLRHCFDDIDEELVVVRTGKTKISNKARMIVISYELLVKMTSLHHGIKVIVCDESHYLKSATAKRSQVIVPMIQAASRSLLLSGTPALNKPSELYQQLIGLLPDFARYDEFSSRYCEKKVNPWSHKMEYHSSRLTDELNLFLTSSIMIRRLKKDVQQELPDKIRSKVPVELDAQLSKEIFVKMKALNKEPQAPEEWTEEDEAGAKTESRALISNLFRLTGEAKANSVCEYIDYIADIEDKFIIFAHHKVVLDKLEDRIRQKKFTYVRIDGSTPQNQREGLVKKFQETGEARIALLSITACGHGLNMTAAGTAVFAELYWVPGQIMQAEDRCHRMGTTHSIINIHYCIAEKTIDDVVWNCLDRKWNGISSTLDGQKQTFEDNKVESNKHATWKTHVPTKKVIVDRRSSLQICEDEVDNVKENDFEPPKQQRRQSLMDDFVIE